MVHPILTWWYKSLLRVAVSPVTRCTRKGDPVHHISFEDLKLALDDLFTKRKKALRLSSTGRTYEPLLQRKRQELGDVPKALRASGKPLADQLADADGSHDGFGYAIWYTTEAYLRAPGVSDETVEAAARIRKEFVPSTAELQKSFATEASRAQARERSLGTREKDLKRFKLADGATLYDWVKGMLDSGKTLHQLLSDRADATTSADAKGRGEVIGSRTTTLGVLNRMRDAMRDELEVDQSLPRDLEAQVFGYFDELESSRAVSRKRTKKKPTTPTPTPETPAV